MSNVVQIDAATLKDWMDKGEAILIDVREIDEYNEAHIPGSILVPMGSCHPAAMPHNPDKKLVFQCKAGVRGGKVCEACATAMPEKTVYNLEGGIQAWMAAGYAVK
ncbi:MAG TPA: rhodanese-like domain-containing protein [Alphaproteobacteria bacterium]|nr:rhodanese-like domain-containing protein [Alphaproteobacteria bacterium]